MYFVFSSSTTVCYLTREKSDHSLLTLRFFSGLRRLSLSENHSIQLWFKKKGFLLKSQKELFLLCELEEDDTPIFGDTVFHGDSSSEEENEPEWVHVDGIFSEEGMSLSPSFSEDLDFYVWYLHENIYDIQRNWDYE